MVSRRPVSTPGRPASGRVAFIDTRCLELQGIVCSACAEACALGAIRILPLQCGLGRPLLDAARCDACGECLRRCSVAAIDLM